MQSNAIDWRAILVREVAAAGKEGKARVAARLGVSRAYVSRVMSTGKSAFAEVPKSFIDRVISRFHVISCPALAGLEVPFSDCAKGNRPCPTSNVRDLRIWRACQTCPNKPAKE